MSRHVVQVHLQLALQALVFRIGHCMVASQIAVSEAGTAVFAVALTEINCCDWYCSHQSCNCNATAGGPHIAQAVHKLMLYV